MMCWFQRNGPFWQRPPLPPSCLGKSPCVLRWTHASPRGFSLPSTRRHPLPGERPLLRPHGSQVCSAGQAAVMEMASDPRASDPLCSDKTALPKQSCSQKASPRWLQLRCVAKAFAHELLLIPDALARGTRAVAAHLTTEPLEKAARCLQKISTCTYRQNNRI